jgi:hypothetical protein
MAARAQLEHMRGGGRPALPMSGRGIPGMPGGAQSDGESPGQYL